MTLSRQARASIAACVAHHAAMTGSRFAVSLVGLQLGLSAFQVGVAVALYALVPALAAMRLGRWIDRIGTRRPALAGMAATGAGLLLPALRLSPATLALGAAAVGAGYATLVLATQRDLGATADPAERGRALSMFAFATAVSSSLGPLLAGSGLARLGARATFALGAALALAALLAMARRRWPENIAEQPSAAARTRLRLRGMLSTPGLRAILLADLALAVAWNANTFVVPLYGARQGWPADVTGRLLAVFGAAVLLARAAPGAWRRRLGDWAAIRLGLACSGGCLAALAACRGLAAPFVLEAIMGLALGGTLASVLALLHEQAPAAQAGEVLGLRLVVLNASAIVLPVALGGLAAAADLGRVLWLTGLAAAAGLLATGRPAAPGDNAACRR